MTKESDGGTKMVLTKRVKNLITNFRKGRRDQEGIIREEARLMGCPYWTTPPVDELVEWITQQSGYSGYR